MGDCEGGEEDEDGGEFDSIVGTWTDDDYLLSVCWSNGCLCMIMVFVNVFLLIMVI